MEKEFNDIVEIINNNKKNKEITDNYTTENKLDMYKYYKQATVGDCNVPEPWKMYFETHAKWSAWYSIKGMSKEEAMKEYIDLYNMLKN